MENTKNEIARLIAAADTVTDREELESVREELRELLSEGFVETQQQTRPYSANLEMTAEFKETHFQTNETGAEAGFGQIIGGVAIDVANALSRAERRVTYRLKTLFGFDGIRLVEEGDSWTQYPILLQDITDQLSANDDIAIYSVGAAGDLVDNMANQKEYLKALKKTKANGLIISGGGNDLFGDMEIILHNYSSGATPASLIKTNLLNPIFETIIQGYRTILSDVADDFPNVLIFGHGYDLPFPQEDGNWIGPALELKGIPFDVGREILSVIMDRFNDELAKLEAVNTNFIYTDLRGKVDQGRNSWFDELHPKNAGYGRAADLIEGAIRGRLSDGAELARIGVSSIGLESSIIPDTVVLDPGHGGTSTIGGSSPNNAIGPKGTLEKHLTLDVAKRTRDILTDRGFKVLLTRDTDTNLGLSARASIAKAAKAAAFVSIHFNGSKAHNAQGTETFVHSSLSSGGQHSKELCLAVQQEMVDALGLKDRNSYHSGGIKYGKFGVINPGSHNSATATVLHEVSFLDRADEEIKLQSVSYRRKIATALADGIETYLGQSLGYESSVMDTAELGDAFELAQLHPSIIEPDAPSAFDLQHVAPISNIDFSNGHLIAESNPPSENFLRALATSEAQYVTNKNLLFAPESEGDEPSDFDPAVEAAFGNMSSNIDANLGLLRGLFGGVESSSFDHSAFAAFIGSLGLRHFSPGEFLALGGKHKAGKCAGKNTLPPKHLWHRIANTARMIDEIRERLGASVYINSAYRSPTYNTCIDGATKSQHMNFNALDWRCSVGTPTDWIKIVEQVQSSNSNFNGFTKAYSTFVHIDTREA